MNTTELLAQLPAPVVRVNLPDRWQGEAPIANMSGPLHSALAGLMLHGMIAMHSRGMTFEECEFTLILPIPGSPNPQFMAYGFLPKASLQ